MNIPVELGNTHIQKNVKSKYFIIEKQAGKTFNLMNHDIENNYMIHSIFHSVRTYLYKSRKNRKNKSKILIDSLKVDDFGFLIESSSRPTRIKSCYVDINRLTTFFPLYKSIECEDRTIAMHPKSNRCKSPCGLNVSMLKHYLMYIKNLPYHEMNKILRIKWEILSEFGIPLKRPDNLDKYHLVISAIYRTIGPYRKSISFDNPQTRKIHGYNYDLSSTIIPGHYVVPVIEVKCPCSYMGCNRCNKNINLSTLAWILNQLDDYKYMHEWYYKTFIKSILYTILDEKNKIPIKITKIGTKTKNIYMELHKITCFSCGIKSLNITYKKSKNMIDKKKTTIFEHHTCPKCDKINCGRCGNSKHDHYNKKRHKHSKMLRKCPPPPVFSDISNNELQQVEAALGLHESRKCPTCNLLTSKDDACDKVVCNSPGCGTHFCFRCGDDITELGNNYLSHLVVTMKPDGSHTSWVCKKFCKNCPACDSGQYWDGASDKIQCGMCHIEFDVDV